MKLTQKQKDLLNSVENKNLRKEIKKEFKKIGVTFYTSKWKLLEEPIISENGKIDTDRPNAIDFLSQHPMNGISFKDEFENKFKISNEKKAEYNRILAERRKEFEKKFNELADNITPEEEPKQFCVEITEDNKKVLEKIWDDFKITKACLPKCKYMFSNLEFTVIYFNDCTNGIKVVSTEEFLKRIGREDLIEPKNVKLSELPSKTFDELGNYTFKGFGRKDYDFTPKEKVQYDFKSANLSNSQIEKVIEWMNTWEQLKDTAIPIRFEEDFRAKNPS